MIESFHVLVSILLSSIKRILQLYLLLMNHPVSILLSSIKSRNRVCRSWPENKFQYYLVLLKAATTSYDRMREMVSILLSSIKSMPSINLFRTVFSFNTT